MSNSTNASTSVGAAAPIDLSRLSELLGTDDTEEIFEMVSLLIEELPNLLPNLKMAWKARDEDGLRKAAHKAKGAAISVAAMPLAGVVKLTGADL